MVMLSFMRHFERRTDKSEKKSDSSRSRSEEHAGKSTSQKSWPHHRRDHSGATSAQARKAAEELGVEKWLVCREDVHLGQKLGKGAFGTVHSCRVKGREEAMVGKVMNPRQLSEADAMLFKMEVKIWSELDHPACVKFLGVCLDPKEYILLCALCEGGSLSHRHFYARQARKPPLSTAALVHQATTIAEGMEYLHERNIMHRDLKSQNILIGADNELKISDFGLAKFAPTEKAELTAETGSYRWMAPEVLRHERYDKSCDVYSYAIVCWEMLTYQVPFADLGPVQAAFSMALRNERPDLPDYCHPKMKHLIQQCWSANSEDRPSFTQLLKLLGSIGDAADTASPSASATRTPTAPTPSAAATVAAANASTAAAVSAAASSGSSFGTSMQSLPSSFTAPARLPTIEDENASNHSVGKRLSVDRDATPKLNIKQHKSVGSQFSALTFTP
mmetsp:Transcript_26920/g.59157  ORF Transcript_26920/g.59157 Transcript_26920/m.59157 type:complete len:447 (-) Transcript_26920:619-1959(-)